MYSLTNTLYWIFMQVREKFKFFLFIFSALCLITIAEFWLLLHNYGRSLMAKRTSMHRVHLALLFQTQMRPTSLYAQWPSDAIDRRAPEFEHLVTSRCYTLSSPGVACVEWSNSWATKSTPNSTVSLHNSRSMTCSCNFVSNLETVIMHFFHFCFSLSIT